MNGSSMISAHSRARAVARGCRWAAAFLKSCIPLYTELHFVSLGERKSWECYLCRNVYIKLHLFFLNPEQKM